MARTGHKGILPGRDTDAPAPVKSPLFPVAPGSVQGRIVKLPARLKKFIKEHMQFGCKVEAAEFDEETATWTVTLDNGRRLSCRFLITAIGMLSAATLPRIEGVERFKGQAFHTYYWPHEPVELLSRIVKPVLLERRRQRLDHLAGARANPAILERISLGRPRLPLEVPENKPGRVPDLVAEALPEIEALLGELHVLALTREHDERVAHGVGPVFLDHLD